jgi:2-polyprenyl-3-methyl-5-hydroxy-6-metoxy-1,4-benzoquinol methylase
MKPTDRLSQEQSSQRDQFNKRARKTEVDFDHYSKKHFGPWCSYWYTNNLVEQLAVPGKRLLSFGCGRGEDALRYEKLGYEVWGFDISDDSIDNAVELAARYQLGDRSHFSVHAGENIDYPDQFFDVVVGVDVLHHVEDL